MDTLRGHDGPSDKDDFDRAEESAIESPPAVVTDERRLQVRAYSYWASLLGDRALPSIEDLSTDQLEEFGPRSILLDFTKGAEDPAIVYLGADLRQECGIDGTITRIGQVPARSLLSRITEHYRPILASAAPIGFEADFINQRGADILYRGILMPFSSDGDAIDFVFGVINWKELIGLDEMDALEQEVDAALQSAPSVSTVRPIWAKIPTRAEAPVDDDPPAPPPPPHGAPLADWLALAQDVAEQARTSEARSHGALYRAIGMAYDFALAARDAPQDYAELLNRAGIRAQARSPMTAVVKLVFGSQYDKTRITEYATALDHGWAAGLAAGLLGDYLGDYVGGLKELVRHERTLRRSETPPKMDSRSSSCNAMKTAPALDPLAIATDEDGLAVVVARREADGSLAIVAALPEGSDLGQRVMAAAAR